jgi:hypothetical protein
MSYVAKFHSDDDKQNIIMAGCADKKIYQIDMDSGDVVQEYDQHLGAVNSVSTAPVLFSRKYLWFPSIVRGCVSQDNGFVEWPGNQQFIRRFSYLACELLTTAGDLLSIFALARRGS